jgi:hypothetical protein
MKEEDYKELFQASYDKPLEAEKRLSKKGYKFQSDLSSPESKVFLDPEDKPIILHRGTHRLEDWGTDIKSVLLGKEGRRTKEARELTKKVQSKFGKPVTAVGTSLGGFLSEQSGAENVITYNKATRPKDIFKKIKTTQTDIRTSKDIISLPSILQRGGKKITKKVPFYTNIIKAHSTEVL